MAHVNRWTTLAGVVMLAACGTNGSNAGFAADQGRVRVTEGGTDWQVSDAGRLVSDVECDATTGTCLLLQMPDFETTRVVDLDTGIEQSWPSAEEDRPGYVQLASGGGRFFAAGGSYYWASLLEVTPGGSPLAWSNGTGCAESDCPLTGMFTSVAVAAGTPYALFLDGTMLRGGASWEQVDAPVGDVLWQAIGSSGGELFALGEQGIYRFDGSSWTLRFASPGLSRIWIDGSGFVAALGQNGELITGGDSGWSVDAVDGVGLSDLWGTSASDVWAVGNQGRIFHWDGSSWNRETLPPEAADHDFVAVTGTAAGGVIAASWDGVVVRRMP